MKNNVWAILILILALPIAQIALAESTETDPQNVSSFQNSEEDLAWDIKTEVVAEKKKQPRKPCEWERECTDVPRPDGSSHTVCWKTLRCE